MKNNTQRIPLPVMYFAYAVPHIDAVVALAAFHGPEIRCEKQRVALLRLYYNGFRLRAGDLFGHHKFAAGVILFGLVKKQYHLNREEKIAVQILVQRIVPALAVFEDEYRRFGLAVRAAERLKFSKMSRVGLSLAQNVHPLVG